MHNKSLQNILICRTDHIGDVILTLPMAGILKENYPDCHIAFLVNEYTADVVRCSPFVDEIITLQIVNKLSLVQKKSLFARFEICFLVFPQRELASLMKQCNIAIRVGSSRRWFHWLYCNKLIKVQRKKSPLHEAQLNLKLLEPYVKRTNYSLEELHKYSALQQPTSKLNQVLDSDSFKLILHPLSHGNTRNWPLENFKKLALLLKRPKLQIIITGSQKESELINPYFDTTIDGVLNLAGKLSLQEFIYLISICDGMVVNSTGPMHIAASFGKNVMGLFVPFYKMHPSRWGPIGAKAEYFMAENSCNGCSNDEACHCVKNIQVQELAKRVELWSNFPK